MEHPLFLHVEKVLSMCKISQSRVESDLEKAQRICQQIQKHGNTSAVIEIYEQYHHFFIAFARRRLYDPSNAEDVVSAFWVEILNGNAICGYRASALTIFDPFMLE